jgi:uncharacterized protein (UPF0335 family)
MSDVSTVNNQIRAYIERVERLEEEKVAISSDIKEIYAEAKGSGFDSSILRKIVALRKKDPNKRREEEAVMSLYLDALGMTPMEEYLEGGDAP